MSGLMLKTYDVRIACEFALTSLEEEREEERKAFRVRLRKYYLPHARSFPYSRFKFISWLRRKKLTPEQEDMWLDRMVQADFAFSKEEEYIRLKRLHEAAKYAGDLDKMLVDMFDLELLGPNLRGS